MVISRTLLDLVEIVLYGRIGDPKFNITEIFLIAFEQDDRREHLLQTLARVAESQSTILKDT